MDVSTLVAPAGASGVGQTAVPARTGAPVRVPGRPRRRSGRGTGPQARPSRPVAAPSAGRARVLRPSSCTAVSPAPAAPRPAGGWRLTERGIALVMVTGLLIVTAALTVVGLTAFRVTGDGYTGPGQSVLAQL